MSLWVRYNATRGIWEVSGTDTEQVFSDLVEHHARETNFARWIELTGFRDARAAGFLDDPLLRRFKIYRKDDEGNKRRVRVRATRTEGTFLPSCSLAPPVSPAGSARIYFDSSTNKLQVSENAGAYVNLVSPLTAAVVKHSTTQSITSGGADKVLSFDTEEYDDATYHDNTTNNDRLTVPVAGVYQVDVNVVFSTNGTGSRFLGLRKNGSGTTRYLNTPADGTNGNYLSISQKWVLSASDYMQAVVFQDSGSTLTIAAGAYFSICLIKAS